jgi:serine protease AprX
LSDERPPAKAVNWLILEKGAVMKKLFSLLFIIFLVTSSISAQFTRYVVRFRNKGGSPYSFSNPAAYLSARAIDRRTRYSIAIDSTDLPPTPSYINQVVSIPNVTLLNVSKWLNAIAIQTSDAGAITAINALPFVQGVTGVAARNGGIEPVGKFQETEAPVTDAGTNRGNGIDGDYFDYGTISFNEIHLHNGEFLHNIGLRGQGMQIAMLDGGFFSYTTLKAFDSVNTNGQILSTWDFVSGNASVVEDNSHGMQCLSTIAANIPGQFIGKAPKASFHLFRTEDVATEQRIEEFNWVCGAERSDSSGAEVISTSLGYYIQFTPPSVDHPYSDMDGNTTMPAIAADLAAKKGLMVFASVGNDGNEPVNKTLSTPSDGDSVVAVGAVNSNGVLGSFTSYGPSADGQVKPDLASVGVAALIQGAGNTLITSNGTSFSCPNLAGLGTCLWQGFREFNNMKIVRALQQSGDHFTTPDNRTGYGIPNMKTAFSILLKDYVTSTATVNNCVATLAFNSKDVAAMKYEIERKAPGDANFSKVGEVTPLAGAILANHSYQFTNNLVGVAAGTVSYRVRQIIDTATASFTAVYIDTASFNLPTACLATGTGNPTTVGDYIQVQPNPLLSGNTLTLVVETSYPITKMPVLLYDNKGSLVMQLQFSKTSGRSTFTIPTIQLAAGNYFIRVLNGTKSVGTANLLKM